MRRRDWAKSVLGAGAWLGGATLGVGAPGSAQAQAATGQLTVWVNADKGWRGLARAGELFTQSRGVKVVVQHFDNAVTPFEEAMRQGKGPDIWIWPHDRLGDWVRQGWLLPLKPDATVRNGMLRMGWDAFTLGNQIWGYPLALEAVTLVWNKALVKTPPRSFEEILALHERLKSKGVRALGWESTSPYFTWPLMAAGGAYVFHRKVDGHYDAQDTGIAHPGALRGAEFVQQAIRAGMLPENGLSYAQAESDMHKSRQAMWITGPWAWDGLKAAGVDFGVMPLPTLSGKPARPFVGVLGAMVTRQCRQPALAQAFLEQVLTQPAGLGLVNEDRPLGVPASQQMFWNFYSDERIRTSMDAINAGRLMPSNPEMTHFWQHLNLALQEINRGAAVPGVLQTAQASIRSASAAAAAPRR